WRSTDMTRSGAPSGPPPWADARPHPRRGSWLHALALSAALLSLIAASGGAMWGRQAETPPGAPLTLERVLDLLRKGTPSPSIVTLIESQGGTFDLTLDDVVRLLKIGASPQLIQAMAAAPAPTETVPQATPLPAAAAGSLTPNQITKALEKGAT